MKHPAIYCAIFLCAIQSQVWSQKDTVHQQVNVFLNCSYGCYEDFLRTQITWVNFVQDQFVAEVDLLITSLGTGSGGSEFKLSFIGRKRFEGLSDVLRFNTNAINTDGEIRDRLAQQVKLGLVRFLAVIGEADHLSISSTRQKDQDDMGIGSNPESDPFNAWVFRIGLNTNANAQKVYQNGYFSSNISASQVKENFKLNANVGNSYSEQRFDFDGEKFKYILRSQYASAKYIHSLNDKWSAGVFTNIQTSDFSNYDYYQNSSLAVEYNIFPYQEAQTKLLTLGLAVGGTYFDFQDTTIFNQTSTLVPNASFNIGTSVTQSWGSLSGSIYAASFLNDFDKKRLGGWLNADVRIYKGLSLSTYISFNIVRDQINIRREGASSAEILLQQQELKTNYNLFSYVGLSYRFGSIYNNVVNPRFDYGY